MSASIDTSATGTRYRFVEHLASGGMADLYVAEAHGVGGVRKQVAIKRVQPRHARDSQFVEMFLNEARLASTLQHPHIVQTYDVLQVRGEYFIVMELLEGCDLQEMLKLLRADDEWLTLPQSLYLVERALAALQYAHDRVGPDGRKLGITHRDVSPHNLFLTYEGSVKLLDFGIAKVQSLEKPTETNMLKGKVLYMAPEQCQAGAVDRRTDIYAAGVLLYRLLGNAFPHRGNNAFDTMRSIIHDTAAPLRALAPSISPELDALVMKAIAKNPDDRWQTAREMQLELVRISRSLGDFVSDLDFAGLVRRVALPGRARRGLPANAELPRDLVIGAPSMPPPPMASTGRQELVSTETAVLERTHGVLVLQLRGAIDEQLPVEALTPHVDGDLVVDTEHVVRVTSYGIRQMLSLFSARQGRGRTFHARMSPTYVEQVSMVRGMLGGGSVISFQLPYVDPKTGTPFTEMVEGEAAKAILTSGVPPEVPCPGFAQRTAEFDDDPAGYLCFASDFLARPPDHVAVVAASLESGGSAKPVEKTVDAEATTLRVLRPMTPAIRWPRLVRGVEGHLVLDLEKVPYWDDDGLQQLSNALESVSKQITMVEFQGVPIDVYRFLRERGELSSARWVRSVRLPTTCSTCSTPRQVIAAASDLPALRENPVITRQTCHRCGGVLRVDGELPELTVAPAQPRHHAPAVVRADVDSSVNSLVPPSPAALPTQPTPKVPVHIWAVLAVTVFALLGSLMLLLVALATLV